MHEQIAPDEATRRTAGAGALLGLALVHVTALPYSLVQGRQIAAISVAAIVTALALAVALARAGGPGGRVAWRLVGALGALTGAGWVVAQAGKEACPDFDLPGIGFAGEQKSGVQCRPFDCRFDR